LRTRVARAAPEPKSLVMTADPEILSQMGRGNAAQIFAGPDAGVGQRKAEEHARAEFFEADTHEHAAREEVAPRSSPNGPEIPSYMERGTAGQIFVGPEIGVAQRKLEGDGRREVVEEMAPKVGAGKSSVAAPKSDEHSTVTTFPIERGNSRKFTIRPCAPKSAGKFSSQMCRVGAPKIAPHDRATKSCNVFSFAFVNDFCVQRARLKLRPV